MTSFAPSMTSFRPGAKAAPPKPPQQPAPPAAAYAGDDEEEEDDDEEEFAWAFVAFLSDGTLRRYEDEARDVESAQLVLGYLAQVAVYEDDPDYAHAFVVKPEAASADCWACCPPEPEDTPQWMAVLKA